MRTDDPQGKRALFENGPDDTGQVAEGRRAIFSTAVPTPGTVVVECSSCGEHCRIQLGEAVARILRLSVWVPFVRHNRWMQCPSCERRTWCRVGWLD